MVEKHETGKSGEVRTASAGGRCAPILRMALVALPLAMAAPVVGLADDASAPIVAIASLEFTEIAIDNDTLAQIRGEGLDAAGPAGLSLDQTAVILWDEERSGNPGSHQSVQVGSFNADSLGSASSAAGN